MVDGDAWIDPLKPLRTSSGKGAVTFSTPLGGYRVFVTGFGMAPPDAEYNIQPFSVIFRIAS